jgi:DNA-binding response OmpR family regulator
MDQRVGGPSRILVVARPGLGRAVEAALRGAGYEVHRTPGEADLAVPAARLRPALVVVALDLPWADALGAARPLLAGPRPVPVLLLGEPGDDARADGMPCLPLAIDAARLRAAVVALVAAPAPVGG